ncbi:protein sex-lethal-like [Aphis craccivora]|uniref:Protein sex-lethal-like n=1 Tax=Aphis craccivora TaxID=307492 RepID=A0A6G0Z9U9_APHCR|nr:protein sex-lethal-like [Aphis craccivora]
MVIVYVSAVFSCAFLINFFSTFSIRDSPPSCTSYRHNPLCLPSLRESPTIAPRKQNRFVARTTTNAVTLIIPDKGLLSSSPPVKQDQSNSNSSSRSSSSSGSTTSRNNNYTNNNNNNNSSSTTSSRRRRRLLLHTPYTINALPTSATATASAIPATTKVPSTDAEMEPQDTSMTNLIINYLPQSMTDKKLHQMFTQIGQIEACRVMKDVKLRINKYFMIVEFTNLWKRTPLMVWYLNTGYSFGFGFVNFVRPEDASRAIEVMNGLQVENKRLKVSYARPAGEDIKDTNLYVQNLPRSITERELEDLFAPYGQIVQKNILKDKYSGLPRGVAFVRYNKKEDAQKAIIQLNGVLLEGCTEHLSVKIAEEHGKQKAAYLAGLQTGLAHRAKVRIVIVNSIKRAKNLQNMHQFIRANHVIDKYPNPMLQHVDRHTIGAMRQDRASYRHTPVGMFPPPLHGYNVGIGNGNMY